MPLKWTSSSSTSSSSFRVLNSYDELKMIRGSKLLKDVSTWSIGGPCDLFLSVSDDSHLLSAISHCRRHSLPHLVIGKGSNCLFDDLGFHGCLILNRIAFFQRIQPGLYRVGSGFPFNRLGVLCSNEGFSGLEFAAGVPGTVGGATFMNAGANAQETSSVIESVEVVTSGGKLKTFGRNELKFGYRSSPFQNMKDLGAIVAVTFRLQPSSSARERQIEILKRRRMCQPVGERSAGSVFRNPPDAGVAAGELIERAGLKGFRIGGAMVSNVHANFFVNVGGSTSRDMLHLIALVKDKVDSQFGIQLKEEVLYVHPYPSFPELDL